MKNWTLKKSFPYLLIFLSVVGLTASLVLTYDKIQVLKNPDYIPSCNINPILSCGSVMNTEQASLLGMPNTIFGIIGFTAILTVGVMMLAGGKFNKRFWQVFQGGATLGGVFAVYLLYQGIYRINAVCPWCFFVWLVVGAMFVYTTTYNLRENNIVLPKRLKRAGDILSKYHIEVLISIYLVIIGLILNHFWYYWQTVL